MPSGLMQLKSIEHNLRDRCGPPWQTRCKYVRLGHTRHDTVARTKSREHREHFPFVPVLAILRMQSIRHQEPDFLARDCRTLGRCVGDTLLGGVVVVHNGPYVPSIFANITTVVALLAADSVEAVVASFGVVARWFLGVARRCPHAVVAVVDHCLAKFPQPPRIW